MTRNLTTSLARRFDFSIPPSTPSQVGGRAREEDGALDFADNGVLACSDEAAAEHVSGRAVVPFRG